MEKIWYVLFGLQQEGPYSIQDLKNDPRITPDTLVWRLGFKKWTPIREVSELDDLFTDEESQKPQEKAPSKPLPNEDEIVLDYRKDPPFLFWIIAVLILLAYLFIQFMWK